MTHTANCTRATTDSSMSGRPKRRAARKQKVSDEEEFQASIEEEDDHGYAEEDDAGKWLRHLLRPGNLSLWGLSLFSHHHDFSRS